MTRLLAAILFAALTAAIAPAQQRIPIILDTDLGDAVDDAFALAFAANSAEIDLRAVTTVVGNTEDKARLASKMLGIYRHPNVPIAAGATEPLLGQASAPNSRQYEVLTSDDTLPQTAKRPAANLIVDAVRNSPQKATIVAIGPLTNIALALKLDPGIKPLIERIVLMGGSYNSPEPEYNARWDPAASEIVFRSGVPVTALGLEVTKPLVLRDRDLERLRESMSPRGLFLLRLLDLGGDEHPTLYDPLALAVLLQPELVQLREGAVSISLADGQAAFSPADRSRTVVGTTIDATAALDLFISRISPAQ